MMNEQARQAIIDFISDKENIDVAKKYLNKGVCAIDLAGAEGLFPHRGL